MFEKIKAFGYTLQKYIRLNKKASGFETYA